MNDVSLELTFCEFASKPAMLVPTTLMTLAFPCVCIISCDGTDSVSIVAKRDGVWLREAALEVAREDDGLELRDWRKSSIGISSDLGEKQRQNQSNSQYYSFKSLNYLGRGVLGLDSRERTLPVPPPLPLTRLRDVSLGLAPPALLADRSL